MTLNSRSVEGAFLLRARIQRATNRSMLANHCNGIGAGAPKFAENAPPDANLLNATSIEQVRSSKPLANFFGFLIDTAKSAAV